MLKPPLLRFCGVNMSEIAAEPLPAALKTEDKDEDCDKDSGNQSSEEMEQVEDGTCPPSDDCALAKEGPHCHVDNQNKENAQRKNSIAEELKAKIASVSRRNSWSGSRRGSNAVDSRRGSIQSIKEDPIHEDVSDGRRDGPHSEGDLVTNGEDPTCNKEVECEESANGQHCHVDVVSGQQSSGNKDDNDVLPTSPKADTPNNSSGDKKQILQTISPAEAAESAEAHSNNSTPLTARKVCQTPVNMKEKESLGVEQDPPPVVNTMPPTEHRTQNIESVVSTAPRDKEKVPTVPRDSPEKGQPVERNERSARAQSKTLSRSRSKSRATSPAENRKSRLSSKERKSKSIITEQILDKFGS